MSRRNRRLLGAVFVTAILAVLGCDGGPSAPKTSVPPTVSLQGWTPNDAQLMQYKAYTFSVSGSDPNTGSAITEFQWDFGDGTKVVTPAVQASGNATASYSYSYSTSGSFTLSVVAKSGTGLLSTPATSPLSVTASASPLVVAFTAPAGPVTINPVLGSTSVFTFQIHATNAGTGTISASGIFLNPGDPAATQAAPVDLGNGNWSIAVTYPAAAAVGTRDVTPSVRVVDSNGISSATETGPVVTVKTVALATVPPAITITAPATPTVSTLSSKLVTLTFTLTNQYDNPVAYAVDWGVAGTSSCHPRTVSGTTTTSTLTGVTVTQTHIYPDSFTGDVTVTVTATDSTNSNLQATPQTRTIQVAANQLPMAAITSPQASSVLPNATLIEDTGQAKPVIPPGSSDPDVVVIPANGKLVFRGTGTPPTSGGNLTYSWSFPGGVPSSSTQQNPGEVLFAGVSGKIVAYLVNFTVTDATDVLNPATCTRVGRTNAQSPKTTQKWVVVDGVNTQNFNLSFNYREIKDSTGTRTLSPVVSASHGLGATIQIFQDGVSYSYKVQDALGRQALISVPTRSNQPFWLEVPTGISGDTRAYFMRIPNAPIGPYADPSLVNLAANADYSTFGFQYPTATTGPWNPTLSLVTAQGFAAETSQATQRRLQGTTALTGGNLTNRWLSRPSIPFGDPTNSIPWEQANNNVVTFSGISAYQTFSEWPIVLKSLPTAETPNSAGTSTNLGFNLDYAAHTTDTKTTDSFRVTELQAFRAPGGSNDPYDLDAANWSLDHVGLSPTALSPTVSAFFQQAIYGPVGTTGFSGGLTGLAIPYDPNDVYRQVKPATIRNFNNIRSVFSYSEYLWSRVWAWPLVLNAAQLNFVQSSRLDTFTGFRYSATSAWPQHTGITPRNSSFNLNATGGGVFDASFPAAENGGTASSTGVARFFWTIFTPWHNSAGGATIARTWLADGSTLQPPTAIVASASGDATAALGFVPPQDTMVDKQGRNADGSLNGLALGGYRVAWFNATKDGNGNPVPPDFWVVELVANAQTQHFMVPGSFPAQTNSADPASGYPVFASSGLPNPDAIPFLTDARVEMTSAQVIDTSTGLPMKTVAPGYCWFDIPQELRPTSGTSATLRVYALKAISANNPGAKLSPRALNRTEWIEAIKTATARISVKASDGADLSYIYKIPFNYYWDVVITNGPATPVAP